MALIDQFDELLAQYNRVDERVFIGNVTDFGKKHKEIILAAYALVVKQQNLSLQLKYLILKTIAELKYPEFAPLVQIVLKNEDKVQLIYSALDALVRINTLAAYKIIIQYMRDNQMAEMVNPQISETLKDLFERNPLIGHFDVFYRDRGQGKGIDKSGQHLIRHLPDEHIRELLPCLNSRHYPIRAEILHILKHRPNPMYCAALFTFLKNNLEKTDEATFLALSEAIVASSRLSSASRRLFSTLRQYLSRLEGNKRKILSIALLTLNTPEMIPEISAIYDQLSHQQKDMLFRNLNREDAETCIIFIRQALAAETHEDLLRHILELIVYARDFVFFFQFLNQEMIKRRELLLEIFLDLDPPGLEEYLAHYVDAAQNAGILRLALQYLLRHAADAYYEIIRGIFFSGAPNEVKILVIRYINRFSTSFQKLFIQVIFDDLRVVRHFKKDFLYSIVGLLNERTFDKRLEQQILDQILVWMEESPFDDIVHFVYFFEKLQIRDRQTMELIAEELRLMQNTILKSSNKDELVRLIHMLIRNMEKRFLLKDSKSGKEPDKPSRR